MYSPSKRETSFEIISKSKGRRKTQLATLLINKFRNKFKVNLHKERELDRLIASEIHVMLQQEKSNENALHTLDGKLDKIVKEFRARPEEN